MLTLIQDNLRIMLTKHPLISNAIQILIDEDPMSFIEAQVLLLDLMAKDEAINNEIKVVADQLLVLSNTHDAYEEDTNDA